MESCQKEVMRRIRRNSESILQDLLYKGFCTGNRISPVRAQYGKDVKMVSSIASLFKGKSKPLQLESPSIMDVYKRPIEAGTNHAYLPPITTNLSCLSSRSGALSQSCPSLYKKLRDSSSISPQRTGGYTSQQTLQEAKRSNVTVTMSYLGQGNLRPGSHPDELKVLQQICGGENICVFKGLVTRGEQFQFVSQRHRGWPFSTTLFVNGIRTARISSCCEYRYAPSFQQGQKSCFRLVWLTGGMPCFRCTSLRRKYNHCQQLNNSTHKNLSHSQDQNCLKAGTRESCTSSPLLIPSKPEKPRRRTNKHRQYASSRSTDSEELTTISVKDTRKPRRRQESGSREEVVKSLGQGPSLPMSGLVPSPRSVLGESNKKLSPSQTPTQPSQIPKRKQSKIKLQQKNHKESNHLVKAPDSLQNEKSLKMHGANEQTNWGSNGESRKGEIRRDFYKECVEMSAGLDLGPYKQTLFKANILERRSLQRKLSSHLSDLGTNLELSDESDSSTQPDMQPQNQEKVSDKKEKRLNAQLDAMMTVLNTSDEVEQLVLRNTGLTDDLLQSLAGALKGSPSEVTLLNLNLNHIGPDGVFILLDMLRAKPHVQGLLLFGNQLGDQGVLALLSGLAELQDQTTRTADMLPGIGIPFEPNLPQSPEGIIPPTNSGSSQIFALLELDIGGNSLGSDGLQVLAAYMRHHSHLRYLGLARTTAADLCAWKELFDSLKENHRLTKIILDESNLGDLGVGLLADVLKVNLILSEVDLDRNNVTDVGGDYIMDSLLCRTPFPLRHLSLEGNTIGAGLMSRINREVKDLFY